MSNPECLFPELSPGGNSCSDKGECVLDFSNNSYACACDSDSRVTGISDFNLVSKDCDVNIAFAKFCWVSLLLLSMVALFVSGFHLFLLLRYKAYHTQAFKKQILYYSLSVAGSFLFTILGIWKVKDLINGDGNRIIGHDPGATLAFSFGLFFWWVSAMLFMKRLVELFISQLKMFPLDNTGIGGTTELPQYPFAALVAWVFTFGVFFPCMCLLNPDNCTIYAGIHHVGQGILTGVYSLYYNRKYVNSLVPYFENTLENLRLASGSEGGNSKSSRVRDILQSMLWKLRFEKQAASVLGAINAILYGIFGLWPYLLRRATYAIGFGFASAAFMITILVTVIGIELRKSVALSAESKVALEKLAKAATVATKQVTANLTLSKTIEEERPDDRISYSHYRAPKKIGLLHLFRKPEKNVWESRELRSRWMEETSKIDSSPKEKRPGGNQKSVSSQSDATNVNVSSLELPRSNDQTSYEKSSTPRIYATPQKQSETSRATKWPTSVNSTVGSDLVDADGVDDSMNP